MQACLLCLSIYTDIFLAIANAVRLWCDMAKSKQLTIASILAAAAAVSSANATPNSPLVTESDAQRCIEALTSYAMDRVKNDPSVSKATALKDALQETEAAKFLLSDEKCQAVFRKIKDDSVGLHAPQPLTERNI